MLRRRTMSRVNRDPVLIKLTTSPGVSQQYELLPGYKFVDLLIVGGGGGGGTNSGGGGGGGLSRKGGKGGQGIICLYYHN